MAELADALASGASGRKTIGVRISSPAPMYTVYILQSLKDGKTYTGFSENIIKRFQEHNLGKVKATRNRTPFKILYSEQVSNLGSAKEREKYWKSEGGRRKLKQFFK